MHIFNSSVNSGDTVKPVIVSDYELSAQAQMDVKLNAAASELPRKSESRERIFRGKR